MTNEELVTKITEYVVSSPDNYISEEDAIYPSLAGLKLYESPLAGFASAEDDLFHKAFKMEGVIHPEYMTPEEWLPGAKTVISFFLPFSKAVKESNRHKADTPYDVGLPQRSSTEWLHARIEGQNGFGILPYTKMNNERQGPSWDPDAICCGRVTSTYVTNVTLQRVV